MTASKRHSSDLDEQGRQWHQNVCIACGRRGTRGFIVLSGKAGQAATQVICESRKACERRRAQAERGHEWT